MAIFKRILPAVFLVAWISIFYGCGSGPAGPDASNVNTTVSGRVLDEADKGVAGATVSVQGMTATTDGDGYFVLKDLSVPAQRCVVACTKQGYVKGYRSTAPVASGNTTVEIVLLTATVAATVPSSSPGTITLSDGGSVTLPPGGFQLENGTSYSGNVEVVARRLDPESMEFGRRFPGDILGIRTDASEVGLRSYGVMLVELRTSTGEPLQLSSGKTATLTFPVPASMAATAPATMPLWYFDESAGKWKEEGVAVRNGNSYSGSVKHFTPWNCDDPLQNPCFLHVRVLTRRGKPAGGVRVRIGQIVFITDDNGDVRGYGTQQTVAQVPPELNFGIGSDIVDVPCQSGQAVDRTITIDGATVSGLVFDCDGHPIRSLVYATWGTQQTNYVAGGPGPFNLLVPAGEQITVHALGGSSKVVGPLAAGDSVDVGTLVVCKGGGSGGPKPDITFQLHLLDIDEQGNPTSGIDTVVQGRVIALDTVLLGRSHVTLSNWYQIAHESGGDISTLPGEHSWRPESAMNFWFPDKWMLLPVASKTSRTLPAHDSTATDFSERTTGDITYEGEEQLMVNGEPHTTQRFSFTSLTDRLIGTMFRTIETVTQRYWYAADLDIMLQVETISRSGTTPQDITFFGGERVIVISYSRK